MANKPDRCRECDCILLHDNHVAAPGVVCDYRLGCVERQLANTKLELKRTKESLQIMKDGWFESREIIGKLWWFHPAIDSDEQRAYYQNVQKQFTKVDNG